MDLGYRPIKLQAKSGLVQVASNIWTIEADGFVYFRPPLQPRYPYPHRAVVIRLDDGSLFVHSPISLTPEIRKDLDTLGTVRYLVSPNFLHHLHLGNWQDAYPDAMLYASPRLASRRKDLRFQKTLATNIPEPEWAGQVDQHIFGSNGMFPEIVFLHRESRTVIFTDLIMDFDPEILSRVARTTTRWNQMYRRTPLGIQLLHTFGRASLRRLFGEIRAWKPKHLIVAHSPWLCVDGEEEVADLLDSAFNWLNPQSSIVGAAMTARRLLALLLILLILPIHGMFAVADTICQRLRPPRSR